MIPQFPNTGYVPIDTALWIAIITTIPPTIVAFIALIQVLKSKKAIQEVHLSINSRMDELLKSSKAESKAEGREQGRNETK